MEQAKTTSNISSIIQLNIENLDHLKFLFDASEILGSSLDYEETLAKVAKLAVPRFADWCTVHISDSENALEQIVVEHKDPKMRQFALDLQKKYPSAPNESSGVYKVLKTGQSEIMTDIPQELLLKAAKDAEHAKLIKKLHLVSYMSVALKARGRILGVISFVLAESGKHYSNYELTLAEELAHIAAVAVDNALLFKQAQDEIAKRKAAEEEVLALNKSLEQKVEDRTEKLAISNRELQDFAYVASHDLQEPLRKIQAFGDLLKEEYGEKLGDGSEYVDRMLGAAGRMRTLINDLLSFSRITTKAQPFSMVDLNHIVTEVLSDLEISIDQAKATVDVKSLPTIEADPLQMRQLFQNLISNALKFKKENTKPVVTIHAKEYDTAVEIFVEDNGIGFDEKYLDRIFTIFERLHSRNEFSGTGIGLAVCRKIVERHKGTITAKSKPNHGATFIITLPKQQG